MTAEKLANIIQVHVPEAARAYCFELWQKYPFHFTLRKSRETKVGDFIWRTGQAPQITVNADLHPYLFLLTYIHEVAHLVVHRNHGHRVEAHGDAWKQAFIELMVPVMRPEVFPKDLLRRLTTHMRNPKASSFSDAELTQILRSYDPHWNAATLLSELPAGSLFGLKGKWFRKGELQRTRFLCIEVKTKRKFLVPADLPVESAQLSLL